MPAGDRRFWPRPKDHIHVLGELRQVYVEKVRVTALAYYETSVERDSLPDEMPALRVEAMIGDSDGVFCTICRRPVADWHIGQDAMDALLEKLG